MDKGHFVLVLMFGSFFVAALSWPAHNLALLALAYALFFIAAGLAIGLSIPD